jgi:hypothetical protein
MRAVGTRITRITRSPAAVRARARGDVKGVPGPRPPVSGEEACKTMLACSSLTARR